MSSTLFRHKMDINSCSAAQLTSIPGIDKPLADSIIRFRQGYGKFTYFDELWKVSGMCRSKYQMLKRQFHVDGEHRMKGTQLPPAKLSLGESMIEFMSRGQNVEGNGTETGEGGPVAKQKIEKIQHNSYANDHKPHHQTAVKLLSALNRSKSHNFPGTVTGSTVKFGLNYNEVRTKTGKNRHINREVVLPSQIIESAVTTASTPDDIPVPPTTPALTQNNGVYEYQSQNTTGPGDDAPDELHNPYDMVYPQLRGPLLEYLNDSCSKECKGWKIPPGPGYKKGPTTKEVPVDSEEEPKPSITLKPSASGNNISFSCTIDKRLLNNLDSPLNLDFSQAAQKENEPSEQQVKGNGGKEIHTGKCAKKKDVGFKVETEEAEARDKVPQTLPPAAFRMPKHGKSVSTECYPLTSENLLLFDSRVRMTHDEKRTIIDAWVEDVNEARDIKPPPQIGEGIIKDRARQKMFRIATSVTVSSAHLHPRQKKDPQPEDDLKTKLETTFGALLTTPLHVHPPKCKSGNTQKNSGTCGSSSEARDRIITAVLKENAAESNVKNVKYKANAMCSTGKQQMALQTRTSSSMTVDAESTPIKTNQKMVRRPQRACSPVRRSPPSPNKAPAGPGVSRLYKSTPTMVGGTEILARRHQPTTPRKNPPPSLAEVNRARRVIQNTALAPPPVKENKIEEKSHVIEEFKEFKSKFSNRKSATDKITPAVVRIGKPRNSDSEHNKKAGAMPRSRRIKTEHRNNFTLKKYKSGDEVELKTGYRYPPLLRKPRQPGETNSDTQTKRHTRHRSR